MATEKWQVERRTKNRGHRKKKIVGTASYVGKSSRTSLRGGDCESGVQARELRPSGPTRRGKEEKGLIRSLQEGIRGPPSRKGKKGDERGNGMAAGGGAVAHRENAFERGASDGGKKN